MGWSKDLRPRSCAMWRFATDHQSERRESGGRREGRHCTCRRVRRLKRRQEDMWRRSCRRKSTYSGYARPISVQENQIRHVLRPIFLVAKRPFKCMKTSLKENFLAACAETEPRRPTGRAPPVRPQASICSSVRLHGRLYLFAMYCSVSTTSASLPSPTRYLGVSLSRITVTRIRLMTRTMAPLANHT